jgi:hypothetical protein
LMLLLFAGTAARSRKALTTIPGPRSMT